MKRLTLIILLTLGVSGITIGQNARANAEKLTMQGNMALEWGYPDKACEYYRKATVADPKYADAYYYWGVVLTNLAEADQDDKKYKEGFEKYKKATQLNPETASAYNDWACSLMQFAKSKNKIKSYTSEAEKLLKKAENLGEQMAAYNLGCLFALQNKKEKSLEWLNIMMTKEYKESMPNVGRMLFDQDEDFDNIRQSDEFIQFLNTNFPNELPEKFQII